MLTEEETRLVEDLARTGGFERLEALIKDTLRRAKDSAVREFGRFPPTTPWQVPHFGKVAAGESYWTTTIKADSISSWAPKWMGEVYIQFDLSLDRQMPTEARPRLQGIFSARKKAPDRSATDEQEIRRFVAKLKEGHATRLTEYSNPQWFAVCSLLLTDNSPLREPAKAAEEAGVSFAKMVHDGFELTVR